MNQEKCAFCESYESWKSVNEFKQRHPEYYDNDMLYEIVVAIVVRHWRKGHKRQSSAVTDYRTRGCGYALNYCPECGRRLK